MAYTLTSTHSGVIVLMMTEVYATAQPNRRRIQVSLQSVLNWREVQYCRICTQATIVEQNKLMLEMRSLPYSFQLVHHTI